MGLLSLGPGADRLAMTQAGGQPLADEVALGVMNFHRQIVEFAERKRWVYFVRSTRNPFLWDRIVDGDPAKANIREDNGDDL